MLDAYTHLDMSLPDPLAALEAWMKAGGVDRAFVVETWSGDNRTCLDRLIESPAPQFRVALCFRPGDERCGSAMLAEHAVGGIRVRTYDLRRFRPLAASLEASQKWLIPHAEEGIGKLVDELLELREGFPGLKIFLPHLGWPRRNGQDEKDWRECVSKLGAMGDVVAGISAIEHFSNAAFPHDDVKPFAMHLRDAFGPESLCAASDYPLFEAGKYVDFMHLAIDWIGPDAVGAAVLEACLFGDSPAGAALDIEPKASRGPS